MAFDGYATAFLTPYKHVLFEHHITDVTEPNRRLVEWQTIVSCQSVDQLRGRDRFDHRAALISFFDQMAQNQRKDAMGIDEIALSIHSPNTISIAVCSQP
jgi:hypothetical protein